MIGVEVGAALVWAVVIYHVPTLLRRWRETTFRAHWLSVFSLAMAFTFALPALNHAGVDSRTWADLTALAVNGFTVIAAGCVVYNALHTFSNGSGRARSQRKVVAATGIAVATMITLFLIAHPVGDAVQFYRDYGDPWIAAYRSVFLLYLGGAILLTGIIWVRRPTRPAPRIVRVGLGIMITGAAAGLAYVASDATLVAKELGWSGPAWWGTPNQEAGLMVLALGLILTGAFTSLWFRIALLARMHLAIFRLRELRDAGARLSGGGGWLEERLRWTEWLASNEVSLYLHGVVGEMRDILAWLERGLTPEVLNLALERSKSSTPVELDVAAFVAASSLRTGMQRLESSGESIEEVLSPERVAPQDLYRPEGFWEETRFLETVARYFHQIETKSKRHRLGSPRCSASARSRAPGRAAASPVDRASEV